MDSINNLQDFQNKISTDSIFDNIEFNLQSQSLKIQSFNSTWITFNNCIFNCLNLNFVNINDVDLMLEFTDCTFNCDVNFSNSILERISFNNTKSIKSLNLTKGISDSNLFQIEIFEFSNNSINNALKTKFSFKKCNINKYFIFKNINHSDGSFEFYENNIGRENDDFSYFSMNNSTLTNIHFSRNTFNPFSSFNNTKFANNSTYNQNKFFKNVFNKVDFSKSTFLNKTEFYDCDFKGTTWFENCKYKETAQIGFIANKFLKYCLFDNSDFNTLEIKHCLFEEKVSFENITVNKFELHQVSFAKNAYFDDINKINFSNVYHWDRKTLRAIKRELVNTHNQIDYLKFKSCELYAYKEEKGKSWRDDFILSFNRISNNFGLDWVRGVKFTIVSGGILYLLYLITFIISVKSTSLLPNSIEDFLVTFLKFINPISLLKSPIEESENYFFPFLFLIIGKISVSYGVYQTAQAFRKFGVNGG